MSYQVKRRIFSGVVCEQEVYSVSTNRKRVSRDAVPRIRFQSEEERQRHKDGISRRRFVQLVNANFSPTSFYSTMTFDAEHEIYTFQDARRIRDNYVRRLKYVNPDAVICVVMGRGKSTSRIHLHLITEGIDARDLIRLWPFGDVVECKRLRAHNYYNGIDYGQDYTALATYLWNHWTPEQGGHRYKFTRNAKRPIEERPTEPVQPYSLMRPPRPPRGYALVEAWQTEYGYSYFKYIRVPKKDPKQGDRGDLLMNPCKYVKFWNEEGYGGKRRTI